MARTSTQSRPHIKVTTSASGKLKYHAHVWYDSRFIASKTFDTLKLAEDYKTKALADAVNGTLKPASERRALRQADASLDLPMTHWSELYVKTHPKHQGDSRAADYLLVGRLLADKSLRDFAGKPGAQLVQHLSRVWFSDRQPKRKSPAPAGAPAPKPLAENTVRLRLTALTRLLDFAASELPADATFQRPEMSALFDYKLPRAHRSPRQRQADDEEYANILRHVGPDSDFGQFLRVIDDTGCRLSEVRNAQVKDVAFLEVAGQLVGGCLTLHKHKTDEHVGPRNVPLSLYAAEVLKARALRSTDGALFAQLGTADDVCSENDEACKAVGIEDLLLKDFRRSFINRNKGVAPYIDLVHVVGESRQFDEKHVTPAEVDVMTVTGHTSRKTTARYSVADVKRLAVLFTSSSRWPRTLKKLTGTSGAPTAGAVQPPMGPTIEQLNAVLVETLQQLARLGKTAAST